MKRDLSLYKKTVICRKHTHSYIYVFVCFIV